MNDQTRNWLNQRLGGVETLKSWNGTVVAHPDGNSVQEALDAVPANGMVVVVGEHHENDIQIPNKRLQVLFWGGASIRNDSTDGRPTLQWPTTRGSIGQIWYRPRLIGNLNSGAGLYTDPSDSETQRLSIVEPYIVNHGGPGLHLNSPVLVSITGQMNFSNIKNNGKAMATSRNILVDEESPPGILGTTMHIDGLITRGCDINIDVRNGVGHYLGRIIDIEYHKYGIRFGRGNSNSTKDNVRKSQIHHCYFEDYGAADIRIEGGYANMKNEPNLQTGTIWWKSGPSVPYQSNGMLWMDPEATSEAADSPTDIYQISVPPTVQSDYTRGLGQNIYLYYRDDLLSPELRAINPAGTVATVATF